MVYERIPPPPPRINLWEFEQVGKPSPDDLVCIRFENGDSLYVARDKTRAWRPAKKHMPYSLVDILEYDGDGFTVSRGVGGLESGFVVTQLVLKLRASAGGWRDDVLFISDSVIASIRPEPRRISIPTHLEGELALWNSFIARKYARDLKKSRS